MASQPRIFKSRHAAFPAAFALMLMAGAPVMADDTGAAKPSIKEEQGSRPYLPANGKELTELLKGCSDESCFSYLSGAINGIGVYSYLSGKPSPFCSPQQIDKSTVRDAILETTQGNDTLLKSPPAVAILATFSSKWPCPDTAAAGGNPDAQTHAANEGAQENDMMQISDTDPAPVAKLTQFLAGNISGYTFGDPNAPVNKHLIVLSDPNCPHCQRFKPELEQLAGQGWKISVYPVAVVAKASKGFAAVQITAQAAGSEKAAKALFDHENNGSDDISEALKIAEQAGLAQSDILESLASGKAYGAVEKNTRFFADIGGKGTPLWFLDGRMHAGFTSATDLTQLSTELSRKAGTDPGFRPGLHAGGSEKESQ